MKNRWLFSIFLAITLWMSILSPARADGIIIPPEPIPCRIKDCPRPISQFEIRYHRVKVTIQDHLAITHVDQVFFNPSDAPIEGTYLFPIPAEAAVSQFTLWMDDKPVQGSVLDATQARQIYRDAVNRLRDPALLEYTGRGAISAHIFPIPPQGERRIELEYTQALTADNGLVRYTYPLNTEKFSAKPLQEVSISVDIADTQPIRAVYSPTHPISASHTDANHVAAGYEAKNVTPDADFTLYYSLGQTEAFHLFTYRDPSDTQDPDGFFLLLLAPQPTSTKETISKDVLLVLDHSGSMEGEKFTQAKAALKFILTHLNAEDRFHLLTFSTGTESYAPTLRPASEAAQAIQWAEGINAAGSTDIDRALLESAAVADRERPTYLIFLTDGLPTHGVQDSQTILTDFARSAPANLRLFSFGVGYDVDTTLLDSLAQEHHGQSSYVRPGEALDEILSAFYERISAPVLTDLKLDFGTANVRDLYPTPLPDLFAGGQIVTVGRYQQSGNTTVTLTGKVNDQTQTFSYPQQAFAEDTRDQSGALNMLPRLWATRKVGYLLNQIRLNGPNKETIDQIVRLSIRYGIVTPYTSYLVTEPLPLGQESQDKIANDALTQAQAAPAPATGKGAVDRSAQEGAMQSANAAPAAPASADPGNPAITLRTVGSRTFLLQNNIWTDTTFDPQTTPVQRILFLSPEYNDLLTQHPDLLPAFSLSQQVIVVSGGTAYQVVQSTTDPTPATVLTPTKVVPVNPKATRTPTQVIRQPTPTITPLPGTDSPVQPPITIPTLAAMIGAGTLVGILLLLMLVWRAIKK